LTVVNDEMVWASPKTSRSRRSLSLDADTVVVALSWRRTGTILTSDVGTILV